MSDVFTSVNEAVLVAYQERLPGCRAFLANFFLTCGDYPPEVNYLNYVRDLGLYSTTKRSIRENLSTLVGAFYEITRQTPEGLAARVEGYSESAASGALPGAAESRIAYRDGEKEPVTDYHRRVDAFKKDLLERTLRAHAGNRTYAARALGLQRTYLLRLIRGFGICVPIQERRRRD